MLENDYQDVFFPVRFSVDDTWAGVERGRIGQTLKYTGVISRYYYQRDLLKWDGTLVDGK